MTFISVIVYNEVKHKGTQLMAGCFFYLGIFNESYQMRFALASIVDADIYVHGHTHLPMVFKEAFYRVSESNSSVSLVDKLFVNTAAALNYGGYGDKQGFKPASKCSPVIYLHGTRHDMWAKL